MRTTSPIGRLRLVGIVEAISFLLLLGVAMPLKYAAGMPMAVKIAGWIHGLLFILFCIALIQAWRASRWSILHAGGFLIAALLPLGYAGDAKAQEDLKRVALVIGNDDYAQVPKLQKAVNDAKAIGAALEGIGFTVLRAENLTRREMNRQLQSFASRLEAGDEAVFFFAGHGVEIAGRNYLLPTDVPGARPGPPGTRDRRGRWSARCATARRAPGAARSRASARRAPPAGRTR